MVKLPGMEQNTYMIPDTEGYSNNLVLYWKLLFLQHKTKKKSKNNKKHKSVVPSFLAQNLYWHCFMPFIVFSIPYTLHVWYAMFNIWVVMTTTDQNHPQGRQSDSFWLDK